MIIFNSIAELQKHLDSMREEQKKIGFVPTMGALHEGHISLIQAARQGSDHVISSIFVNPTQFNDLSDLEKYPRTMEADCRMLENAGCDSVFAPDIGEIYSPAELELKRRNVEDKSWTEGKKVDFGLLDKVMEGALRPGHFNGVAQVVSKLFRIIRPDVAFFGRKDFQQLVIIKSMVKQLGMPVRIVSCPTLREPNGLAMSSRNERLSPGDREKAGMIYDTLCFLKQNSSSGDVEGLKRQALAMISSEPGLEPEYLEIVDPDTLLPLKGEKNLSGAVACIAVKLGSVRLIDNMTL
jgi:pantoate--beta-alanine ligase